MSEHCQPWGITISNMWNSRHPEQQAQARELAESLGGEHHRLMRIAAFNYEKYKQLALDALEENKQGQLELVPELLKRREDHWCTYYRALRDLKRLPD
jgi:hypothetical protein